MLRAMDWWTFEGVDALLPPSGLACVMQDLKLLSFNIQWFRDLGASFSSFGCFVFESWVLRFRDRVLRFRDLGASFSRFGCFVLRSSFLKLPISNRKNVFPKPQKIVNPQNKTPAKFSCYTVVLSMFSGCRF